MQGQRTKTNLWKGDKIYIKILLLFTIQCLRDFGKQEHDKRLENECTHEFIKSKFMSNLITSKHKQIRDPVIIELSETCVYVGTKSGRIGIMRHAKCEREKFYIVQYTKVTCSVVLSW